MKQSFIRIAAIARKELRLNFRFPVEYIVHGFISPAKSALMMCLLYSGFFRASSQELGSVTNENFVVYVLLGTVLHSQMTASVYVFWGKMMAEKYWQTATATLLTPVSVYELIAGFVLGSGAMSISVNVLILSTIAVVYHIPLYLYAMSLIVLMLIAFLGFGLGLIGGTVGLCWEGKTFLFDYSVQAITFLSCFYYPIQFLPGVLQKVVQFMPTYQLSNVLHDIYVKNSAEQLPVAMAYMLLVCLLVIVPAGYFFDRSMRRHGVVGY